MHLPSYVISESANDYSEFKFISNGPKGNIVKVLVFQKLPVENLYNLSLSDVMSDGLLSDTNVSNNNDLRKILTTTIQILMKYTELFPERNIFFQGSDDKGRRISLYHKVTTKYYSVLEKDFTIIGITDDPIEEEFNPLNQYSIFGKKKIII